MRQSRRALAVVSVTLAVAGCSASTTLDVAYPAAGGVVLSDPVVYTGDGLWKTATYRLDAALWNGTLAHGADLRLEATGPADLEVRFVRLVKRQPDVVLFLDGFENGSTTYWDPRLAP